MIKLKVILSRGDRALANRIITENHSYVPSVETVGRHIDYLIYYDGCLRGMIGIGSSTYPPCKDILHYLSISKNDYKENFNSFCNNWKFCLLPNNIKNLGSMTLKALRETCQKDWYLLYGDTLKYIITFVGDNKYGGVYRADNWVCVGETSGLPTHTSVSMKWDLSNLDNKFVKPTGENKKLIFIKELPEFKDIYKPTQGVLL